MPSEISGNPFKKFWLQHETKIVLVIGLVLVAIISFEFGYVQGKQIKDPILIIEKPLQEQKTSLEGENDVTIVSSSQDTKKMPEKNGVALSEEPIDPKNCAYVGSKNSDKFYPPTCSYAKRIKPENITCFASAQEAISKGRTESSGCAK